MTEDNVSQAAANSEHCTLFSNFLQVASQIVPMSSRTLPIRTQVNSYQVKLCLIIMNMEKM